jgi:hypothetical protein
MLDAGDSVCSDNPIRKSLALGRLCSALLVLFIPAL